MANEASAIVTVSSGAGVDVDGIYIQLFASTARATTWVMLHILEDKAFGGVPLAKLDIATGVAASEVDRLIDLGVGHDGGALLGNIENIPITFPFAFAAGLRLSARIKDQITTGIEYNLQVRLFE